MRLRPYRFTFYKKRMILIFFAMIILYTGYVTIVRIYPNYIARIEIYANNIANKLMVSSLSEVTSADWQQFSRMNVDKEGYVSSTSMNSVEMNRFKVALVSNLQNKLDSLSDGYIYIPVGSLTKKEFLSGVGPKIKIKISPGAMVKADLEDEFTSCGINQVKHKTFIRLKISMTFSSVTMRKSFTSESVVPVVENIISGVVPKYYGMNNAMLNDN